MPHFICTLFLPTVQYFKIILKSVHFCFCKIVLEYATFYMHAVFTHCTIFFKLFKKKKILQDHCATLILSTLVGLPHSFICTRQAAVRQNRSSACTCSPCTSNCTHHTAGYSGSPTSCSPTLKLPGLACLRLNAVHLFHSCLCLWSPSTVLFFPLSSPQWRHLSPTTPILYVHGRCGPFIH